jgi:nucleoside-diphosphate-sugar epimerase
MSEYHRYLDIKNRVLPGCASPTWLAGLNVLVTGGTGCIGSKLLDQITSMNGNQPRRIMSASRMISGQWPRFSQVEYVQADIRDECAMRQIFASEKWDVVFHLAAQRDPGLAEKAVRETVTTNVFGTQVVLRMCGDHGVERVIAAGTGKAFRYYSDAVYTACKRAAEWLLAMTSCIPYRSTTRFTHVMDNGIVRDVLEARALKNERLPVHAPGIMFYVQSAGESAQLLWLAGEHAVRGVPRAHAINFLGFPVDLTEVAAGMIEATGSESVIEYTGYDPGYEPAPFAGLSDPRTADDVSPLINPFEAPFVDQPFPGVDAFPIEYRRSKEAQAALSALWEVCVWADDATIRQALDRLSWALLDDCLAKVAPPLADRIIKLCQPHVPGMSAVHLKVLDAIDRSRLGPAYAAPKLDTGCI